MYIAYMYYIIYIILIILLYKKTLKDVSFSEILPQYVMYILTFYNVQCIHLNYIAL